MRNQGGHSDIPVERERKLWYARDVAIVAALVLGSPYSIPVLSYIAGLRNDVSLEFSLFWLTVCGLWPALLICLVILIGRMVHTWPRHIADRERLWFLRLSTLAVLTGFLGLPFTPLCPPGPDGYDHGFRQYVLRTVDIPAVQAWLSPLSPDLCDHGPIYVQRNGVTAWPDTTDWPQTLTSLDPFHVRFQMTDDGRVKMRLAWGTPFRTWGLEIGPRDMPIPKTRPRQKDDSFRQVVWQGGEYRLRVAPGAYVWREIR